MCTREREFLVVVVALLFAVALVLLTGCDLRPSEPTAPPAPVTGTPPTPDPEAGAQPTAVPADSTPQGPPVITMTVWTTEVFSPTQAITAGRILAEQVAAFEQAQSDVQVEFVVKKPYGKGGILDYLMTTAAVVPDLLPDLVFMDVDELSSAVGAELAQPLNDLISPDLVADLYPFAREACTFDGRLYGLQYLADLDHLVYNTGRIAIPPRSWPGVLSNPGPYLFPAGGVSGLVNDAFLIQYLAVRGYPAQDDPLEDFLDEASLVAVLQFYQDGASRGIFGPEILDYHITKDCWEDYVSGHGAFTQVGAHRYLTDRDSVQSSAPAPIPAIQGPATAIGHGWALALVAQDTARQGVAAEFLLQLMDAETNAAWNQAANYLPTRQAALASEDPADNYAVFVGPQLLAARARPSVVNYTQVAAALQEAVEAVLTGALTPEEAAAQVVSSTE